MTGLILAAGEGRRLAGEPKALLPFRTWRLIDLQLACFDLAGVDRRIVVTRHTSVADYVAKKACVFMSGEEDSALVLAEILKHMEDDVVIVEEDILFYPGLLESFLSFDVENAAVITNAGDRQVSVFDGRIVGVGYGDVFYGGILKLGEEAIYPAVSALKRGGEYWDAFPWGSIEVAPFSAERFPVVDINTQQDSLVAHRDVFPRVLAGLGLMGAAEV